MEMFDKALNTLMEKGTLTGEQFVEVLKGTDSLFVVPVFAAWSETGKVDGQMLARQCGGYYLAGSWQDNASQVMALPHEEKPLLVAVLGAGDIEEIIPYL
jgi:UDP-N-acetylmuramate--alanine ligase